MSLTKATESEPRYWMSPDELAHWLGVPVATVYNWRHKRTGPPARKVGRHLRYRRDEVEAWLDSQAAS